MNYQRLGGRIFRGLVLSSLSFSSLLFLNPSLALAATASNLGSGPTISQPANAAGSLTPLTSPGAGSDTQDVCGPVAPGYARCLSLRRTDVAPLAASAVSPAVTVYGYGPADLRSAYNLPSSGGAGLTVAIVDAYDQPRAESDLAAYRSHYGLPACTTANGCFQKVDQTGGTNYPAYNQGWGVEIDLDLDMVSAACPNCHILLVEANDAYMNNLGVAVNLAVSLGAVAVSNSYVGAENGMNAYYDGAYYNHPGVAIVAGSGDCGYNCEGSLPGATITVGYPAASQYVVAVGGTKLVHAANARGWSETAWGDPNQPGGAGAGCSLYETKPAWQHDPNCAKRMVADVSAVADPSTGMAEYDFDQGGWIIVGGTSAATPIIAAAFALGGRIGSHDYPASYLYAATQDLNDVVGGNSLITDQSCPYAYFCQGVAGYDGPTGLGTPHGINAFHSPFTVPGAPTNVSASPYNASAAVTWTAPANNGGLAVSAYTVTAAPGAKTCATNGALTCTVSGLTNGQAYSFSVVATNTLGNSLPSAASSPVTPFSVPGKPTAVTAVAGNTQAGVAWTAPANNGSAISSYLVTSSPDNRTCATSATNCTVSSLTNGRTYSFTVSATNSAGPGPASDPSNSVTPATVPDPPTAVGGNIGNGQILLGWTAPANNGGSPLTAYTATSSPGAKVCTTSATPPSTPPTSCLISGLTNGQTYQFTVTATNARGTSSASAVSPSLTPLAVPGRPSAVSGVAGVASVTVSWTATADLGLGTFIGYTATAAPGGGSCTTLVSDINPTTCPINGLTNGTSYTFTVVATNSLGNGWASDPSAPVMPRTVPNPPTAVSASAGSRSAAVSWTAPAFNGGATITSYIVTASPGGQTCSLAINGSTPLTCTVSSLTNGQTYQFSVTATNIAGTGAPSALSAAVTPLIGATYVPVTPNRLVDSRAGAGQQGLTRPLSSKVPAQFGVTNRRTGDASQNIPAGAVAITGNLTAVSTGASGYLALTPTAPTGGVPSTSTLNFPARDSRANAVTVPLSPTGTLWVTFVGAGGVMNVVFDVTGYFISNTSGATYLTVTPNRLVDSRPGVEQQGLSAALTSKAPVSFGVTGRSADPAKNIPSNAVAVTGNLTAVSAGASGYFALTPAAPAGGLPSTSTLNFPARDVRANAVTVPLGAGGRLYVTYVGSGGKMNVVFDVTGYFVANASGASYVPVTPNRLADSRSGAEQQGLTGALVSQSPAIFTVTNRQAGNATQNIPVGAIAITGNLTAVSTGASGYFALTPTAPAGGLPSTSTLNFPARDVRANAVTVPLGTGGGGSGILWVTFVGGGGTMNVVFDVTGYFLSASAG